MSVYKSKTNGESTNKKKKRTIEIHQTKQSTRQERNADAQKRNHLEATIQECATAAAVTAAAAATAAIH